MYSLAVSLTFLVLFQQCAYFHEFVMRKPQPGIWPSCIHCTFVLVFWLCVKCEENTGVIASAVTVCVCVCAGREGWGNGGFVSFHVQQVSGSNEFLYFFFSLVLPAHPLMLVPSRGISLVRSDSPWLFLLCLSSCCSTIEGHARCSLYPFWYV